MSDFAFIILATIGCLIIVALTVIFIAGASICNDEYDKE